MAPALFLMVATGTVVTGQPPAGTKLPPADFKVTSADLCKECKEDRKAAEAKYKGKVVEIEGTVRSAHDNYNGEQPCLFLLNPTPDRIEAAVRPILCYIDDPNPCGKFSEGQSITIRGRFDQVITGPVLKKCEVVKLGPDLAVHVSAVDLAKAFTADQDAARKKYDDRTLLVTGEIVAFKQQEGMPRVEYLELKGDGETVIECRYPVDFSRPRSLKGRYKVGDTVRLACTWTTSSYGNQPKRVVIGDCVPMAEQPKAVP